MSLFDTLNTGASGMGASSTRLSVIGDNIANIGSTGFKSSTASFADTFPNYVQGAGGVASLGTGAGLADIGVDFSQGTMSSSSSALDVALLGNGFFQVTDGDRAYYTRDGSFHLDADNRIVNSAGLRVQGYAAVDGTVVSTLGDLTVDPSGMPQQATGTIAVTASLSASADHATEPLAALRTATPFDGTAAAPTMDQLAQAADFSTSVTTYDSLGVAHDVSLFFERSSAAPETWTVTAVVDGGEVDSDGDGIADLNAGSAYEIGTGTVTFGTQGELVSTSGLAMTTGWSFAGADPFAPDIQLGLDAAGNPTGGGLSMKGEDSFVTTVVQDGHAAGFLDSLRVEGDGTIVGIYSNGQQSSLGQLAVATFRSNAGLDRVGGNLFQATPDSGDATLGAAGVGGRAETNGFSLESSNVDLEDEFVDMIQAQRTYQANTGVIRTADEALQQLIQIV